MNDSTNQQYDAVLHSCRDIFLKKTRDYGTSWRVLRPISIADQLFIKAKRIRTLQEAREQRVEEDKSGEFRAMVNYGIIGLIQLSVTGSEFSEDVPSDTAEKWYDEKAAFARKTMLDKNHDYGEAWRDMSQEGYVDLIMMKILRIRQIVVNDGKTLISEGIDSNYIDIINYSVFALIMIGEGKHSG